MKRMNRKREGTLHLRPRLQERSAACTPTSNLIYYYGASLLSLLAPKRKYVLGAIVQEEVNQNAQIRSDVHYSS